MKAINSLRLTLKWWVVYIIGVGHVANELSHQVNIWAIKPSVYSNYHSFKEVLNMSTRSLLVLSLLSSSLMLTACSGGGSSGDSAQQSELVAKVNVADDSGVNIDNSESDDVSDDAVEDSVNIITDDELVTMAMASGDPSQLPDSAGPIINKIQTIIETEKADIEHVLQTIYGNNNIDYQPSRHSQFVTFSQREGVYPLIRGNKGLNLAAAVNDGGHRSAAFGTNLIRSLHDGSFLNYEGNFINLLSWLLKRDNISVSDRTAVSLAFMDSTTASRTTSWINDRFENWEVTYCASEGTLSSCVANADLLIAASQSAISASAATSALKRAQANGAALLYVHTHSWNTVALTNPVLSVMNLSMQPPGSSGNYFTKDAASWDSYKQMLEAAWDLEDIYQLVNRLEDGTFSFELSNCATDCDASFSTEFKDVVASLRTSIQSLDKNKVDIFNAEGYKIEKLLVLLGDFYRRSIVYPMDVGSSVSVDFLKAYYADHLVYNNRVFNPAQPDLGNFSRSDFSHITTSEKTINLISKKNFRSAGVYALPGQTVSVTRNDNSDVNVSVFINTQRSASTKEFGSNQYRRPKFLKSTSYNISAGETIQLTSPYGGPVQLSFSTNNEPVEIHFNNIGLHPHWSSADDNSVFAEQIAAGDFDWAEIVTPHFEIHSQLSKMRSSLSNEHFKGAQALAEGTEQYIHNYPHVLAGFQGPGIDVVPEIHDFAELKGWTINNLDIVKHMNADQPTCGSGCSGNPYDAGWNFNPIGHGDIHEFGHGLEQGKFRFSGWEGHASTNPYSYYSKSQFHTSTDTASSCQSLPFDRLFNTLLESMKQVDSFAYMKAANLTAWNDGISMYIQMMMAAQDQGSLNNGWHLLARLHILLREFQRADDNDEVWAAARDSLGFGQFTRNEARALSNNDWLLIAISVVTERDYRDFLTMWGLSYSDTASAQVAAFGFDAIPKVFYQTRGNDYCDGLDKQSIAISDRDADGVIDAHDAFPDDGSETSDADGDGIGDNVDNRYDLNLSALQYHNVELKSDSNSLCIGINSSIKLDGQVLMAIACSDDHNTLWSWGNDGRLHAGADSSLCISSSSLGNGARLSLSACSDASTKAWRYDQSEKVILNMSKSDYVFDQYGNKQVNLYGRHGGSNQKWTIIGG